VDGDAELEIGEVNGLGVGRRWRRGRYWLTLASPTALSSAASASATPTPHGPEAVLEALPSSLCCQPLLWRCLWWWWW
jgi:hypothetical protein